MKVKDVLSHFLQKPTSGMSAGQGRMIRRRSDDDDYDDDGRKFVTHTGKGSERCERALINFSAGELRNLLSAGKSHGAFHAGAASDGRAGEA